MTWLLHFIFWLSVGGLFHSYFLFPLLMQWAAKGKQTNMICFEKDDANLPLVSVLMSVYNEEKVIAEKIQSLLSLDYPIEKLRIFIGSDCSSDGTHAIIEDFIAQHPSIRFFPFKDRRGKPPVINELAEIAKKEAPTHDSHVFLMTDASVMLRKNTLWLLVRHFKNPKIGVVDAHMQNIGQQKEGISKSESTYINRETNLKDAESRAWGKMIGPFGGCYALKASLFEPVPANYLVDDFYITFRAMEKGFSAINELDALCFEGATHAMQDEFRRKKRIAAGSFQNLQVFRKWVLPPTSRLGFAFFSHKVLRWLGGFLLCFALVTSLFLGLIGSIFYQLAFVCLAILLILLPCIHFLFKKMGIQNTLLKNITYFNAMNLALMAGFFKYLGGIRSNVWQPTKRY